MIDFKSNQKKIIPSSTKFLYPSVRIFLFKAFPKFDPYPDSSEKIDNNRLAELSKRRDNLINQINKLGIQEKPSEARQHVINSFINFVSSFKINGEFGEVEERFPYKEDETSKGLLALKLHNFLDEIDEKAKSSDFLSLDPNVLKLGFPERTNIIISIGTDVYFKQKIKDFINKTSLDFEELGIMSGYKQLMFNYLFASHSSIAEKINEEAKSEKNITFTGYEEFVDFLVELFYYFNSKVAFYRYGDLQKQLEDINNQIKNYQSFEKIDKYYLTLKKENVLKLDITPFFMNCTSTSNIDNVYATCSVTLLDSTLEDKFEDLKQPVAGNIPFRLVEGTNSSKDVYNYLKEDAQNDLQSLIFDNLHLADLIQPNDFIVIYARNSSIPLSEVAKGREISLDDKKLSFFPYLDLLGYRKIFAGFVTENKFNEAAGTIPTITLTCKSSLYLLEETLRIFTPGLFQKAFYSTLEVGNDTNLYTALNNLFANYNVRDAVLTLLTLNLGLKIKGIISETQIITEKGYNFKEYDKTPPNELLNPLTVPIFLMHIAFKEMYDEDEFPLKLKIFAGGDILDKLQGFLIHIQNSFKDFSPTLKTPMDIIKEMSRIAFFEFFEDAERGILFRPLSYDAGVGEEDYYTLLDTSNVINFNRSHTINQIFTRVTTSFYMNILQQLLPFLKYPYTNGKLLLKYGLRDGGDIANPNIRFGKTDLELSEKYHQFALFYLTQHNYSKQIGNITFIFNSDLKEYERANIGMPIEIYYGVEGTSFVGYVTSKTVTLAAGGTLTESYTVSYLRASGVTLPNYLEFFENMPTEGLLLNPKLWG